MSKTYVNGRSIVHKGDGQTDVSPTPDVCKTPSPGGPVPIPYVNVAQHSNLSQGSTSVSIDGQPVALRSSCLSTSTGDEPGTAGGGLISSKTKGKMTWGSYSLDVKIEGKGVVRFMDTTQHNANTGNCVGIQNGSPQVIWGYGNDPVDGPLCPHCEEDKSTHVINEAAATRSYIHDLISALNFHKDDLRRQNVLKTGRNKTYMVGVLVCKGYAGQGGGRIYAAMSGENNTDGFEDAVKALNAGPGDWTKKQKQEFSNRIAADKRWTVCPGSKIDFSQVINCRGETSGANWFQDREKALQMIEGSIPELLVEDKDGTMKPLGRPDPGVCAAPKLIQRALKDGHFPLYMTEALYAPPPTRLQEGQKPKPPYRIKTLTYVYFEGELKKEIQDFGHGDSVPSCVTCQSQLTPMLCGNAEAQCE